MVKIKSKSEIEKMRIAGRIIFETFERVAEHIHPGVTTYELDRVAEKYICSQGCTPTFKGYGGFPATACISVNNVVIHGIPNHEPLNEGDIVSIDLGACYKGYNGDAARTFGVGAVSADAQKLIDVTKRSFFEGIKFAKEGYRISDISGAIQKYVESNGFEVLKQYCGHGVGADLHEDPEIPNYLDGRRGIRIRSGMCLAIEPMVTAGNPDFYVADDEWAVITKDGSLSAHYENSVLITDGMPELLTFPDWEAV